MGPITTNSKRIKIKTKTTVLKSNTSLPSELSLDMFLSRQFPLTQKTSALRRCCLHLPKARAEAPVNTLCNRQNNDMATSRYQQLVFGA